MAKIAKALIIRRLRVESSLEYADTCAASCEKHGIPYEFINGIEFMLGENALAEVGLRLVPGTKSTEGHLNCHASHVLAWKRIIELDEPCIILEHDAIVKGDVRVDIPDMSVVTFGNRVAHESMYEPIGPVSELKPIEKSIGVHACGLTPTTCKWLLNDLETNGVKTNVDDYLIIERQSGLPLFMANPPPVCCWPRISTREWQDITQVTSSVGPTWTYADGVTDEWIAGLKLASKKK